MWVIELSIVMGQVSTLCWQQGAVETTKNCCSSSFQSHFLKLFLQFVQFAFAHADRLSWVRKGPRVHF